MRVRLLPTGKAELLGLAACLRSLFPDHDFETVPLRRNPAGQLEPFHGFTSVRLDASLVPGPLDQLVRQLAAEVHPGRGGEPADLAVCLDDLELANADQPEVVVGRVRQAVRDHLARLEDRRPAATVRKVEQALRERASFHLAVPMMEAWFFADRAVLPAAGVPAGRQPKLRADTDPEAFETDDPAYSADDGSGCTELHRRSSLTRTHRPARPLWILERRTEQCRRERHPKAYLAWLCRDPADRRCTTYREAAGGCRALSSLSWSAVLAQPSCCAFARAMINDLAEVLGPPAAEMPAGAEHPLVSLSGAGRSRVLRNI